MFDGPDEFVAPPVELVMLAAVPLEAVALVALLMLEAIGAAIVELLLPPCYWQYVWMSPAS